MNKIEHVLNKSCEKAELKGVLLFWFGKRHVQF